MNGVTGDMATFVMEPNAFGVPVTPCFVGRGILLIRMSHSAGRKINHGPAPLARRNAYALPHVASPAMLLATSKSFRLPCWWRWSL